MNMLVIEDDDGFKTEWPWPEGSSILHNAVFVDICQEQHDLLRAEWEKDHAWV